MGHSLCSFILRQIPRRSPTHNAVYFTTTRLGGYIIHKKIRNYLEEKRCPITKCSFRLIFLKAGSLCAYSFFS